MVRSCPTSGPQDSALRLGRVGATSITASLTLAQESREEGMKVVLFFPTTQLYVPSSAVVFGEPSVMGHCCQHML